MCLPGGILNRDWQRYSSMASEGGLMAGLRNGNMGLSHTGESHVAYLH